MKTEIVNIPNRGICILISDIDPNDFMLSGGVPTMNMPPFTDVNKIAHAIRTSKKIQAIKEIRSQTGWGLKEAKDYIDKYFVGNFYDESLDDLGKIADQFVLDHAPVLDFLDKDEMEL